MWYWLPGGCSFASPFQLASHVDGPNLIHVFFLNTRKLEVSPTTSHHMMNITTILNGVDPARPLMTRVRPASGTPPR